MRQTQGLPVAERYRQCAQRLRVVAKLNHDEDVKRTLDGIAEEYEMLGGSLERVAENENGLAQAVEQDRKTLTRHDRTRAALPSQDLGDLEPRRAVSLPAPGPKGSYRSRHELTKAIRRVWDFAWAALTSGRESMTSSSRLATVAMIFAYAAADSLFRVMRGP